MSLRTRVAAVAAIAVAVAVVLTSAGLYTATARTLQQQTDLQLRGIAEELTQRGGRPQDLARGPRAGAFGGAGGFVQLVDARGSVRDGPRGDRLPVDPGAADVARAGRPGIEHLATVDVDGRPVRVLTIGLRAGALQVALPVDGNDATLRLLRRRLVGGGIVGVALAAGLGLLVSNPAVRPVRRLTAVAEEVAATGDLTRRIDVHGDDELARLGTTFNAMLTRLAASRALQEQLVADASHELRTPLTSLRTNIEVLEHADRLDDDARTRLIADVVDQLAEFGRLVDGLVELTRGDRPATARTRIPLGQVAQAAVDHARTFHRDREFVLDVDDTVVTGEQDRLVRAATNMVDNAVKYGADPIEVTVADGTLTVRDHGDGIAAEDLPHVFDRFYRAPGARSAPGSGLGLAIVAQVAASHDGDATAGNHADGGAVVRMVLPVSPS